MSRLVGILAYALLFSLAATANATSVTQVVMGPQPRAIFGGLEQQPGVGPSFVILGDSFVKDGQNFTVVSGSMHYFRVVPQLWSDRLHKLRACGLNTVTSYVPWNLHEPEPGKFNFEGILDLITFIQQAQKEGLLVIIRPPPYICAEFEFGGLPSWLLADRGIQLRCSDPTFLVYVDKFMHKLLDMLAPYQYSKGGPIIAFQVENEYGSWGSDHTYLRHLTNLFLDHKIDSILFASNGGGPLEFEGGTIAEVFKTVNFGYGDNVKASLALLREFQPTGPLFVTEFWDGWFDHWGEKHHTVPAQVAADAVDVMLSLNASVNLYMAHGGTNFGFTSGANWGDNYQPIVTSYDYDAPISESGDPTDKCKALKEVISKYVKAPSVPIPSPAPKAAYGKVQLTETAFLLDPHVLQALSTRVYQRVTPEPMEVLGQDYGFILYSTTIRGPLNQQLIIQDLRDRGLIFVDGTYLDYLERWDSSKTVSISVGSGFHTLDILVENMGRINYGPYLKDMKGITEGVRLGQQFQYHWTIRTLPMANLTGIPFSSSESKLQQQLNGVQKGASFYRGYLDIAQGGTPMDTFISLPGWTKGFCVINGFNLGRYWRVGPQETLYVPGPLLHTGRNELILFELHEPNNDKTVILTDQHNLGS